MSPQANLKTTGRRPSNPKQKPIEVDTLPPHSIEAEQGVLGCILTDPSCLYRAEQRIRDGSVFFDLRHQDIWSALLAMGKNGGIDAITLHSHLAKERKLTGVGGDEYIAQLQDCVPSVHNLPTYLDILNEKWKLRNVVQACTEVSQLALSYTGDISEFEYSAGSTLNRVMSFFGEAQGEKSLKPSQLSAFDTRNDAKNLLGNRWLCRAGKCLIVGPSGRGKSTLNMQMAICWAVGRPFMGIKPVKALKQVLIGDENDEGDLAEMFQGVCAGLGIDPLENPGEYDLLEENLTFLTCPALSGMRFISWIEKWLDRNPVDLAWLDPLVSFADVDLSKQEGAAAFLRQGLSRIASQFGTCWMVIHHSPKPKDPKYTKGLLTSDHQYAGAGSYDLAGWARATITLRETRDRTFCLALSKRGERSGASHPDGTPTKVIYLKHAESGIYWEQVQPEESTPEENHVKGGGAPSKVEKVMSLGLGKIIDSLTEPVGLNELAKRILTFATDNRIDIKINSCKTVVSKLFENGALNKKDEKYFKA